MALPVIPKVDTNLLTVNKVGTFYIIKFSNKSDKYI